MSISPVIIAMDGGSGAGKSSTARAIATRWHYMFVDTGAHYRAVTHCLQRQQIPYTDTTAIQHALAGWSLDEDIVGNEAFIRIAHRRFDDTVLRSAIVNAEVSYYSTVSAVRQYLLHFQRSQAEVALLNGFKGLVMDGRDIGTNIFPNTPFKYFFVADPAVKAARRARDGITDVIAQRDLVDSTQGQLHRAPDAITIDTTHSTFNEVLDWINANIAQRLAANPENKA